MRADGERPRSEASEYQSQREETATGSRPGGGESDADSSGSVSGQPSEAGDSPSTSEMSLSSSQVIQCLLPYRERGAADSCTSAKYTSRYISLDEFRARTDPCIW